MTIICRDSLATSHDSVGNVLRLASDARSALCCTIRRITFASCYVYSPCGSGAACERSRLLRAMLKSGDTHFIVKYAFRVRQQVVDESPWRASSAPIRCWCPCPQAQGQPPAP